MSTVSDPDAPIPGAARCERCEKSLDLNWTFCPFCGEDNRASEKRTEPIAPHRHDFSFGPHCVQCGLAAANFVQPSDKSLVYSVGLLNRLTGLIVIFLAGSLLFTVIQPISSGRAAFYSPVVFYGLALLLFLIGLGILLYVRTTVVDPINKMVIWRRGVWPMVVAQSQPFSSFCFVRVYTVWHSGRYGMYPTYRATLCQSQGGSVYLCERRWPDDAMDAAQRAAYVMGLPVDNEEQPPLMRNLFGF